MGAEAEKRGYGEKKGNGKGTISSALLFVTLLVNTPRSIVLPLQHTEYYNTVACGKSLLINYLGQ